MRVAIIGGGISGLVCAFYLNRFLPDTQITVYEKEPQVGGKLLTARKHGFVIELGGNGFLTNRPDTLDLVRDLGCEDLLLPSSDSARKRFIFDGKALHELPEGPKSFFATKLLGIFSKLRVLCEFVIPRRKDGFDETVQQFGYRRLGKAFTDKFLDAMTAGVFASAPDKLSLAAAFPAVAAMEKEHGGLFRAMMAKKKKQAGPGGVLMSFKGGMSTLMERLKERCNAQLRLDCEVTKLLLRDGEWEVTACDGVQKYDRVIMATPSFVASRLLKELDEQLGEELKRIEYSPVAVVALGFNALSRPLDGFGLLTTKGSGSQALGVLWDSSIFEDRAQEGTQLLRLMIGGQRNPFLAVKDEEELIGIARGVLYETMGVKESPMYAQVTRWHKAIPNYAPGHVALVEGIEHLASRHMGLSLCSNAYRGVSMNDCVKNAKACAASVAGIKLFEAS